MHFSIIGYFFLLISRNVIFDNMSPANIILSDRINTLESLANEQTLWSYIDDMVHRLPRSVVPLRARLLRRR